MMNLIADKYVNICTLRHLSLQRNEPHIALAETRKAFRDAGMKLDFELFAAPRLDSSEEVQIS
jgi:hypothetical protein